MQTGRRHRRNRASALLGRISRLRLCAAVVALVMAACGSDDGRNNIATSDAPATTPVTITIDNHKSTQVKVYMGFNGNTFGCYKTSDFSAFCTFDTGNPVMCSFTLEAESSQMIPFGKGCKVSPAFSGDMPLWGDCPVTMAEFTLDDGGTDTYDLSLVNNLNVGMSIVPSTGTTIGPITSATGNQEAVGVYPQLCTTCSGNGGAPTWPGCPTPDASQCKSDVATYPCQLSQATGASYVVNIEAQP